MKNQNFRVIVTKSNLEGRQELSADDCHTAKSLAGTLFHVNTVVSVCVADITGFVWLYMNKDKPKETWVFVPSALAELIGLCD